MKICLMSEMNNRKNMHIRWILRWILYFELCAETYIANSYFYMRRQYLLVHRYTLIESYTGTNWLNQTLLSQIVDRRGWDNEMSLSTKYDIAPETLVDKCSTVFLEPVPYTNP